VKGHSRVAFALAIGVAVSLVILTIGILYAIVDDQQDLSTEASTLASAVLGGAVGALATYLGQGSADPADPAEPLPYSDDDQMPAERWPDPPDDQLDP